MNLESLGRTLGELYVKYGEDLPQPVKDGLFQVVSAVAVVDEALEEFFGAFNVAAGVDVHESPGDEDGYKSTGYHCRSCYASDAPVDEVELEDAVFFISRSHPSAEKRAVVEELLEIEYPLWSNVIRKYLMEAREAQDPNVWD